MKLFLIYLIIVNVFSFILYGADKYKARRHRYRISERMLITAALIGGSAGAILGMFAFHHKTKHWYFRYGLPVIFLVQIILAWIIYSKWI